MRVVGSLLRDSDGVDAFASGGSAAPYLATEQNLGTIARRSGKFTVAGAGMTIGKPVQMWQAVGPYTGKGTRADEAEMDAVDVAASVTSATVITAYWRSRTRVRGNHKFNYQIGA